jgi:hypothetical protein
MWLVGCVRSVLMHSVMYPTMTHGRASSDSHPDSQNWRGFGGESMFEWALGLWPFKDTFYTNTSAGLNVPLNGQDKGKREHQPYTHTVIAALSGGGVAPGDVIGGTNVPLIMSTCRADGTLLKPTTPSAFIDRYWLSHAVPPPPPVRTAALKLKACMGSKAQQWSLEGSGLMEATAAMRCLNLGKCKVAGAVHLGRCSTQCSSSQCCGGNNTRWSASKSGGPIHSWVPGQCLSVRGLSAASQVGVVPCSSGGTSLLSWHPPATIRAPNGSCLTVVMDAEQIVAGNEDDEEASAGLGIGEVASGETVMQGKVWKYATVIPPNDAFTLAPADVGLRGGGSHGYLMYGRHTFSDPPVPAVFSAAQPIAVSERSSGELQMWVAAPILENGWAILGERHKVVPIAAQRIVSFEAIAQAQGGGGGGGGSGVVMELVGAADESVSMDFAKQDRIVVSATCGLGASGRARLTVSSASSTCEPL